MIKAPSKKATFSIERIVSSELPCWATVLANAAVRMQGLKKVQIRPEEGLLSNAPPAPSQVLLYCHDRLFHLLRRRHDEPAQKSFRRGKQSS